MLFSNKIRILLINQNIPCVLWFKVLMQGNNNLKIFKVMKY